MDPSQRHCMIGRMLSPLTHNEYMEDIKQHMRRIENDTLPNTSLIEQQPDIEWRMRPYLIDFLIEAHAALSLSPETLFLAVNLLDRYCSTRRVLVQYYQLIGCTALLISAKYNDGKHLVPKIRDLITMCDGAYKAKMFAQAEVDILNTLKWTIGHPTVDSFVQLIVAEEGDDQEVEHMAMYLCEIALYHRHFVSTKPSIMGWTSLTLARNLLGRATANDGEVDHTGYMTLSSLMHDPSPTLARKYSFPYLPCVSKNLATFTTDQDTCITRAANLTLSHTSAPSSTRPNRPPRAMLDDSSPHMNSRTARSG